MGETRMANLPVPLPGNNRTACRRRTTRAEWPCASRRVKRAHGEVKVMRAQIRSALVSRLCLLSHLPSVSGGWSSAGEILMLRMLAIIGCGAEGYNYLQASLPPRRRSMSAGSKLDAIRRRRRRCTQVCEHVVPLWKPQAPVCR